jgi:hypothetical protein
MEISYETIDRDPTPLGVLELRRYHAASGEEGYEILIDGSFLMASHGSHSERAMASLAHSHLQPAGELSVLVGGLGAGHTLRAVLDLPGVAEVEVAEIGPVDDVHSVTTMLRQLDVSLDPASRQELAHPIQQRRSTTVGGVEVEDEEYSHRV